MVDHHCAWQPCALTNAPLGIRDEDDSEGYCDSARGSRAELVELFHTEATDLRRGSVLQRCLGRYSIPCFEGRTSPTASRHGSGTCAARRTGSALDNANSGLAEDLWLSPNPCRASPYRSSHDARSVATSAEYRDARAPCAGRLPILERAVPVHAAAPSEESNCDRCSVSRPTQGVIASKCSAARQPSRSP
jgi:hypothetical protein